MRLADTRQLCTVIATPALCTLLIACSSESSTTGPETVEVGGNEWTCLAVPQDVQTRILEGDKNADGANATVEKAVMVEGVDNDFVAMKIRWEGVAKPFDAGFAISKARTNIVSTDRGTSMLFNWPLAAEDLDGTKASAECL